jgi:hypothetical protein
MIKRYSYRTLLLDVIRMLIVFLFVYASVVKLIDHEKFVVQLGQSPMLMLIAPLVSWAVPLGELLIAALLLWPRTQQTGWGAALFMMSAFTTYIVLITRFSTHVPCSCGGVLEKMGWEAHLVFNIVFTALAFTGMTLSEPEMK